MTILPPSVGQLNPGEELKLDLKPTTKVLLPGLIIAVLLSFTIILIPLSALILLVVLWVYFSQVRARRFLVTTNRIILTRRFGSKDRRDIYYENVSDFVLDQGIWGRIFGYGAIQPVTLGTLTQDQKSSPGLKGKKNPRTLYRLSGLPHPEDVLNTIQALRHSRRPQSRPI